MNLNFDNTRLSEDIENFICNIKYDHFDKQGYDMHDVINVLKDTYKSPTELFQVRYLEDYKKVEVMVNACAPKKTIDYLRKCFDIKIQFVEDSNLTKLTQLSETRDIKVMDGVCCEDHMNRDILRSSVEALNKEVRVLENIIETLETCHKELKATHAELETTHKNLLQEHEGLVSMVRDLKSETVYYNNELGCAKERYKQLLESIGTIGLLQNQLQYRDNRIEDMSKLVGDLETRALKVDGYNCKLKDINEKLDHNNKALVKKCKGLIETVAKYEADIDQMVVDRLGVAVADNNRLIELEQMVVENQATLVKLKADNIALKEELMRGVEIGSENWWLLGLLVSCFLSMVVWDNYDDLSVYLDPALPVISKVGDKLLERGFWYYLVPMVAFMIDYDTMWWLMIFGVWGYMLWNCGYQTGPNAYVNTLVSRVSLKI